MRHRQCARATGTPSGQWPSQKQFVRIDTVTRATISKSGSLKSELCRVCARRARGNKHEIVRYSSLFPREEIVSEQ